MIHHWLGWLCLAMCVLLLAKYIGRISKNKQFNTALRKAHKPLGWALLAVAAVHGILCVVKPPRMIFPVISGLVLFALIVALTATFLSKSTLKAKWFFYHRLLSAAALAMAAVHVIAALT